jgi:hypothetical protein
MLIDVSNPNSECLLLKKNHKIAEEGPIIGSKLTLAIQIANHN